MMIVGAGPGRLPDSTPPDSTPPDSSPTDLPSLARPAVDPSDHLKTWDLEAWTLS